MTFPAIANSFSVGFLTVHWYGVFLTVGVMVGYGVIKVLNLKLKILNSKQLDSLFFWLVVWGFIGARMYHILNEPVYYWNHPIDIVKVWNGGLAIHGAIIAGVFVILSFLIRHPEPRIGARGRLDSGSRNKQENKKNSIFSFLDSPDTSVEGNDEGERTGFLFRRFLTLSDLLVIGLALGQAIGRWGNYVNQELFGKPTNGLFRVMIDVAHRPAGLESVAYYHPTFFYESVLNFILFILLFLTYRFCVIPNLIWDPETKRNKKRSFGFLFFGFRVGARNDEKVGSDSQKITNYQLPITGFVTGLYFLGYGLIRFFIDFLRIDPRPFLGGLYLSQWVSLLMIVIGVWIWYTAKKQNNLFYGKGH